jgi:ATP-dependent RNA helicase DDX18/HAS1
VSLSFAAVAVLAQGVAKGLGFSAPPRVNLNIKATGEKVVRRGGGGGFGDASRTGMIKSIIKAKATGHAFSATNPYGKRGDSDKRQFVRF